MAFYRCSLANKVISQQASGSFLHTATKTTYTTNHGFIPDLIILRYKGGSSENIQVYSPEINGENTPIIYFGGSTQGTKGAIGNTTNWWLESFTDTTMTINKMSSGSTTYYWYAYKFDGGTKSVVGNIMKGTLVTSSASTDYVIDTGLSEIHEFWLHGYSAGSNGYAMQHDIYYTADDTGYFQTVSKYGSNGESNRYAIGRAALTRGYVIKSIVGGVVTITTATTAGWVETNLNWTAY